MGSYGDSTSTKADHPLATLFRDYNAQHGKALAKLGLAVPFWRRLAARIGIPGPYARWVLYKPLPQIPLPAAYLNVLINLWARIPAVEHPCGRWPSLPRDAVCEVVCADRCPWNEPETQFQSKSLAEFLTPRINTWFQVDIRLLSSKADEETR